MTLDIFLIAQAEALANGRYVHQVQNMVAAYRAAYEFAVASGVQSDIDVFHEAQADLRRFIHRRRVEKTDPDEYDIDVIRSAS